MLASAQAPYSPYSALTPLHSKQQRKGSSLFADGPTAVPRHSERPPPSVSVASGVAAVAAVGARAELRLAVTESKQASEAHRREEKREPKKEKRCRCEMEGHKSINIERSPHEQKLLGMSLIAAILVCCNLSVTLSVIVYDELKCVPVLWINTNTITYINL